MCKERVKRKRKGEVEMKEKETRIGPKSERRRNMRSWWRRAVGVEGREEEGDNVRELRRTGRRRKK
jgi:hypothetical protein